MIDEEFDRIVKEVKFSKLQNSHSTHAQHTSTTFSSQPTQFMQYSIRTPKQAQPSTSINPAQIYQQTNMGTPRFTPTSAYQYTSQKPLALQHMLYQHLSHKLNHILDKAGQKQTLDQLLNGYAAKIWTVATSNKLGGIAQGIRNVNGNNVMDFIKNPTYLLKKGHICQNGMQFLPFEV